MQRERTQAVLGRLAGFGLLAAGLLFVTMAAWSRWFGMASEAELRLVTGPATDVQVEVTRSSRQKGELLWFRVGERRFGYASGRPGYRDLVAATKTGTPVTVAYGPVKLPFGLRAHAVDVYAIAIASRPIRTYADTIADERNGSTSALVFGGALLALAFFLLRRRGKPSRP